MGSFKRSRLKPAIWQDSYIHLSFLSRFFKKFASKMEPVEKILDFGCGDKPYFTYFKEKCREYIGVDIAPSKTVDIVINASTNTLPFNDDEFDLVLATQVLEHIPNFFEIVKELHRVCKKGGKVIVSVPFCWEFHPSPNDYWRFSKEGLTYLFRHFSQLEMIPDSSALQTVIQIVNFFVRDLFSYKFLKPIRWIIIFINNIIGILLSKIVSKSKNEKLVSNFIVISKK